MILSNYPCSQSALYQCTRNISQSLNDNLINFTDFKAKYNAAFVTDLNADLNVAELTPDWQARSAQSEIDYIDLGDQLDVCTSLWQNLKRYILSAYPVPQQKARLEEAGSNYYDRAIKKNWDASNALLLSANNFINVHQAQLEAAQNMPITFKATFNAAYDLYIQALLTFQQGEEELKVGTAAKIEINNSIYNKVIEICLDGQQIFKLNPPVKDQFTFNTVWEKVSGSGTTGFKGYVTDVVTGNNIAGAIIITLPNTKTIISDPDGYYEFKQIPSGTYTIEINCPGYQPLLMPNYIVDGGVMHNLPINLMPLPVVV